MKAFKKDDQVSDRDDASKSGTVMHDMKSAHNDCAWVLWDDGSMSSRNPYTLRLRVRPSA